MGAGVYAGDDTLEDFGACVVNYAVGAVFGFLVGDAVAVEKMSAVGIDELVAFIVDGPGFGWVVHWGILWRFG